jgi:hypothetical protein
VRLFGLLDLALVPLVVKSLRSTVAFFGRRIFTASPIQQVGALLAELVRTFVVRGPRGTLGQQRRQFAISLGCLDAQGSRPGSVLSGHVLFALLVGGQLGRAPGLHRYDPRSNTGTWVVRLAEEGHGCRAAVLTAALRLEDRAAPATSCWSQQSVRA